MPTKFSTLKQTLFVGAVIVAAGTIHFTLGAAGRLPWLAVAEFAPLVVAASIAALGAWILARLGRVGAARVAGLTLLRFADREEAKARVVARDHVAELRTIAAGGWRGTKAVEG